MGFCFHSTALVTALTRAPDTLALASLETTVRGSSLSLYRSLECLYTPRTFHQAHERERSTSEREFIPRAWAAKQKKKPAHDPKQLRDKNVKTQSRILSSGGAGSVRREIALQINVSGVKGKLIK